MILFRRVLLPLKLPMLVQIVDALIILILINKVKYNFLFGYSQYFDDFSYCLQNVASTGLLAASFSLVNELDEREKNQDFFIDTFHKNINSKYPPIDECTETCIVKITSFRKITR